MAMGRWARTIWASWLALPSRLRVTPFHLLVVLELDLEQPDHLDGEPAAPAMATAE